MGNCPRLPPMENSLAKSNNSYNKPENIDNQHLYLAYTDLVCSTTLPYRTPNALHSSLECIEWHGSGHNDFAYTHTILGKKHDTVSNEHDRDG